MVYFLRFCCFCCCSDAECTLFEYNEQIYRYNLKWPYLKKTIPSPMSSLSISELEPQDLLLLPNCQTKKENLEYRFSTLVMAVMIKKHPQLFYSMTTKNFYSSG